MVYMKFSKKNWVFLKKEFKKNHQYEYISPINLNMEDNKVPGIISTLRLPTLTLICPKGKQGWRRRRLDRPKDDRGVNKPLMPPLGGGIIPLFPRWGNTLICPEGKQGSRRRRLGLAPSALGAGACACGHAKHVNYTYVPYTTWLYKHIFVLFYFWIIDEMISYFPKIIF